MYFAEYKELRGSRILYAKDGWLLAFKPRTGLVFFFNLYTRAVIKFPKREQALENIAFSAASAPTMPNCFAFTMENVALTIFASSMCRPGNAVWTTLNYQSHVPFIISIWNKVVFCKGLFFCLSLHSMLGSCDTVFRTWSFTPVLSPQWTDYLLVEHWRRGRFMTDPPARVQAG